MARRPVPILVIPKPGVIVRLDGVIVPALGLETTVDDELANELLKGTLDDYPAPYHPPGISGTGDVQADALVGSAAGSLLLAGTASGATLAGLAALAGLSNVSGTAAASLAGLAGSSSGAQQLAGSGAGVQDGLTGAASGALSLVGTGTGVQSGLTGAAAGALALAGAAAGVQSGLTGSASGGLAMSGTAAVVQAEFVVTGTQSTAISGPVAGVQAGLTGSASGALSMAGTSAAAQSGLTTVATGALTISGTAAGAQSGLTAAAAGGLSIAGTGIGAQSGLTGAASGAQLLAGSAVGAQSGLTGAATGALRIAGTAAGAQSGLTGAASGALSLPGTAAGAQAGLTVAAAGISDLSAAVSALAFSRVRADTRTEVSSKVSQLQDMVLGGHTFDQATSGNRPPAAATDAALNNQLAIPFTSNMWLSSSRTAAQWKFLSDGSDFELFLILKATVNASYNELISTNFTGGAGITIYNEPTTGKINAETDATGGGVVALPGAGNTANGVTRSINLRSGTAQTPDFTLAISGLTTQTGTYAFAPDTANPVLTLQIGTSNPCGMGFAELIICNRVLTTGERATMNGYISSYYAI